MKKLSFFLSSFFGSVFVVFLLASPSYAFTQASQIQAAATSTQLFTSNTTFEGTVNWFKKGIWIGQQGSGGVTYFNGSIVNSTTDSNGNDQPVTFADNVRIDGNLHRGSSSGWKNDTTPLQVNDNLKVLGGLTVDQAATFVNDVTLTTATLQGTLSASGGLNATRAIATTGGHVATLSQSAADAATATRSALYLLNSGTSASNDYLIYSTPFKVTKDGNTTLAGTLTTTGAMTANGGLTLGDGTTLTIGSGEIFNATGATVSGLESRGMLTFPAGTISANTLGNVPGERWKPVVNLTPVRVSATLSDITGSPVTITVSDSDDSSIDTLIIPSGSKVAYLNTLTNFNLIDATFGLLMTVQTGSTSAPNLNIMIDYTVPVQ